MSIILFILLILSILMHEYAHGFIAYKLGDPTPKESGRLTFNPLAHTDIFGTLILPLVLYLISQGGFSFGYAKPIPINPYYFKYPRKDTLWVALAGPCANIALALVLRIVLLATPQALQSLVLSCLTINIMIAIVNLMPVPPLDGARVISAILPYKYAHKYLRLESFGLYMMLLLVLSGLFQWGVEPLMVIMLSLMGVHSTL